MRWEGARCRRKHLQKRQPAQRLIPKPPTSTNRKRGNSRVGTCFLMAQAESLFVGSPLPSDLKQRCPPGHLLSDPPPCEIPAGTWAGAARPTPSRAQAPPPAAALTTEGTRSGSASANARPFLPGLGERRVQLGPSPRHATRGVPPGGAPIPPRCPILAVLPPAPRYLSSSGPCRHLRATGTLQSAWRAAYTVP